MTVNGQLFENFREIFLHRLSGALELRQRVRPFRAAPFSAPAERGTRTAAGVFALTGRLLFCTDCAGCSNCVSVFAPDGRLLSLHRLSGGRELPQAGSPLTGGEFFAEPQRGDSPSADGGDVAAPAAGAKRKGHLRFPFLFELLPFPYFLSWRKSESGDRFEIGERQRIFSSVSFSTYSQCQINYCYTCGLIYAGAT